MTNQNQKSSSKNKKLALYLDGTWNTSLSNTNVWRLKSLCPQTDSQVVYYSKGVGTEFGQEAGGGALGLGLDKEITDAYEWLIETYGEGDEVFIFGFSRGAFTARSLAGFISKFGLLKIGAPLGVGQLYDRYRSNPQAKTIRFLQNHPDDKSITSEEKWLGKYSRPIPIRFVGVWDTVGSLGIPWDKAPFFNAKKYQFHDPDLHINQSYAFHAMAIDEHRKSFAPTLWTATRNKTEENFAPRSMNHVEQRWFVGAHANVGGGYASDALAQLPLKWLMDKAALHGLEFSGSLDVDVDSESDKIMDSFLEFLWGYGHYVTRRFYRTVGADPIETTSKISININETIDASVFRRWKIDPNYRPPSIVEWAKRKKVDVDRLIGNISAQNPTDVVP